MSTRQNLISVPSKDSEVQKVRGTRRTIEVDGITPQPNYVVVKHRDSTVYVPWGRVNYVSDNPARILLETDMEFKW